jgi:transmembrane sensor
MALLSQRIAELILRDLKDELSVEERIELEKWINESDENRMLHSELTTEDSLRTALQELYESDKNVWEKIEEGIQEAPAAPVREIRPWRYLGAASAILLLTAGIFWLFNNNAKDFIARIPLPVTVSLDSIIAPVGNNSSLTLADGTVINLDSVNNGTLAMQGNAAVIKKEGSLEYITSENAGASNDLYKLNTLRTVRGGQQQLWLPDGSKVLLNAESSITYPTSFVGNVRKVQITGEAYFEIKSIIGEGGKGKMPFLVEIISATGENKGEVEVLGTHFNIKAYDNETLVRTTLVEGKVRMYNNVSNNSESIILHPGQQAQLSKTGKLAIAKDDDVVSTAIAWTKNEFLFSGATAAEIFKESCRWYPITVSFPHGEPTERFWGTFDRSEKLSTLLTIFKEGGIKFRLEEGNKLIVTP